MRRGKLSGYICFLILVTCGFSTVSNGQEIGFLEEFALAENRSEALQRLVPGTEDYYYYHALHHQINGEDDKINELMQPWIKRFGETRAVKIIQNRQALRTFENDPDKTYRFLRDRLKLKFNQQREIPTAERNLPTKLDPKLIGIENLTKEALRRRRNTDGFVGFGVEHLANKQLNKTVRRHLLSRLRYPDYPNLVSLIVKDLKEKDSKGFGSLQVHSQLTIDQLEECVKSVPKLIDNSKFVNTFLAKLQPGDDVNWRADRIEHRAYLKRLYDFTQGLNPAFNSLKANVIYRRLELDRLDGRHDRELFLEYLALPRQLGYVNPRLAKETSSRSHIVNLGADYRQQTRLVPIHNDEPLVRDYLHHFLLNARNYDKYRPYIRDGFLKREFATVKILNGKGNKEEWASILSPQQYKELVDRIDLDFAPTNKEYFDDQDTVQVDLFTKSIDKLIVKIYEINTFNYYRKYQREIDTDVNLDGLVPNFEKMVEYQDDPVLRKLRSFEFPELAGNGVYVVDFIGGGKSSRALVRRGRLSMVGQTTIAGHLFRVFDHNQQPQTKDVSIWVAGNKYTANKDGKFNVPFSNQPGNQSAVITVDGFSTLQRFRQQSESYKLLAAMYVDRESLLRSRKAKLMIRPSLRVAGVPASVKLLKDIQVSINSTNQSGVTATKQLGGLELHDDAETICEFVVPPRLKNVSFELRCTVENISQNQKQDLTASRTFEINQIDSSDEIQDAHLMPTDSGYLVEIRGKSGETRGSQAVRLRLQHRDFKDPVSVDLQSDANGQIELGELDGIASLEATVAGGSNRKWNLGANGSNVASKLHAILGDIIEAPAPTDLTKATRDQLSLFEKRSGNIVADHFDKLRVENGRVLVSELPAGDFVLRFKRSGRAVDISVLDGEGIGGVVLGQHRRAELRSTSPLMMRELSVIGDKLVIDLDNADDATRVHVIGTRYAPRFEAMAEFSRISDVAPWIQQISVRRSAYMAGRNLSDEYQYILNRRYEPKFAGNMLNRPSLLVNPWSVRDTQNNIEQLAGGNKFQNAGTDADKSAERDRRRKLRESATVDFANLDFIQSGSIITANLKPNKNGVVRLDREQLKGLQHIRVVAVSPVETVQGEINFKPAKLELRDMRLAKALDPDDHFAQTKQLEILKQGDTLSIDDLVSGKFHFFDELGDVFRLFLSLNPNTRLAEFEFLLSWSAKSEAEKRTLYSKYACHELNYYLFKKDRAFFDSVVQPHISYKMETGFVDQFLLREKLDTYASGQWDFARLNVFERILLSQRAEDQSDDIVENLNDLLRQNPGKREFFDSLYDKSIRAGELDFAGYGGGGRGGENGEDKEDNLKLPNLSMIVSSNDQNEDESAPADALDVPGKNQGQSLGGVVYGGAAPEETSKKSIRRSNSVSSRPSRGLAPGKLSESLERKDADYKKLENSRKQLAYFADEDNDQMFDLRNRAKALYRRLPTTREWIEQQYYQLPLDRQDSNLVSINRFWRDYSRHSGGSFLSPYFAESHRTLTEMMFALAVMDLPEKAPEHKFDFADDTMKVTAAGPMIALHQRFRPVMFQPQNTSILISENFFQKNDRYRNEDGVNFDKFVSDKFYAHTLYGAQVVVTNPTSTPQSIDLLVQIPRGSVATSNSQQTRSLQLQLNAFSTKTFEYFFYFPTAGEFAHYPAHVSRDDQVLAVADSVDFNVTDQPAEVDKTSWKYVSQNGSDDDVLEFLARNNVQQVELGKIAFRMKKKHFFNRVIKLLQRRYRYDHMLWSFGVMHKDEAITREYLQHEEKITSMVGRFFQSALLSIDPYVRNWYQHREYSPLVNARVHQVGTTRKILNPTFHSQYHLLLDLLANRKQLNSEDHLAVTYYLLLQDRIEEAIQHFGKVKQEDLNETIQFDYCDAYLNFYLEKPDAAESIAQKWKDYPVDHWRNRFQQILAQVEEIRGSKTSVVDVRDNLEQQSELAASTPSFDFDLESQKVKLTAQAVSEVEINYYEMDIELMFSRNPFQHTNLDGFSVIKPIKTQTVALESEKIATREMDLPTEFRNKNVLVEIRAGDQVKAKSYFANSMSVQTIEKYGQLKVTSDKGSVSKAYVKVYSRNANGQIKFHKDGYTDLRGRFDYVTQSNNPLDGIQQYSILILSPEFGATTRQVTPPAE